MEARNNITSSSPDCEIESIRNFNYTREAIFNAWTDPNQLKNWWGPNGFTNTFHEFDLRPGGKWSFTMHGPDGKNYPNESIFVEIIKPELIVFNHITNPKFQVVATFEEDHNDTTKLTFRMIFDTPELCSLVKLYAVEKNEENFDRLEVELQNNYFFYV